MITWTKIYVSSSWFQLISVYNHAAGRERHQPLTVWYYIIREAMREDDYKGIWTTFLIQRNK